MRELVDTVAKYIIALVVVVGCLVLIFTEKGDPVQPWLVIGLVIGWIIRDSAGNTSAANLAKAQAAVPPVVVVPEA